MLTLMDRRPTHSCSGYHRREFLRVGGLGLGLLGLQSLSLSELLAIESKRGAASSYLRDKSIVLLYLSGGPSHIEFFDPKMTAPSEFRSVTGEVQTSNPGLTLGGTFPKLAERVDRFSIVRSYGSKNSGHTYERVSTGGNPLNAAMGAVYARVVGNNDSLTGMPTNVLLKPEAIDGDLKLGSNFETSALPTLTQPGSLGMAYQAFDPSGGGAIVDDMQLQVEPDRLTNRRGLLRQLDGLYRHLDRDKVLGDADSFRQQAFDMIARGVVDAFDLSKERPATIAKYDTTGVFRQEELQRYGDMRRVTNLLGHQMLLARRLCEAGCRFITVSDCGWDMHANGNSPKGMTGIWPMGHQVDHAVSAFIDDIEERGLTDKVLLIVTGEMGRTPRINGNGGRDHYGELTPLLLSGGGLKMGQVIGQSDRTASKPVTEPYDPGHLFGTVMHTLFDVGELRLDLGLPNDISQVITDSAPIGPLFD